jgi:hypothetical protein
MIEKCDRPWVRLRLAVYFLGLIVVPRLFLEMLYTPWRLSMQIFWNNHGTTKVTSSADDFLAEIDAQRRSLRFFYSGINPGSC